MTLPRLFSTCIAAVLLLLASPIIAADDPLSPAAMRQRIQAIRTAEATLTVLGADGKPLANTAVVVRQTNHKFLFGCNAFGIDPTDNSQLQSDYQKHFTELFNYATLPFYWSTYEPVRGDPQARRLQAMAQWCQKNHVRPKGHPLCWHNSPPHWYVNIEPDEALKILLARIDREVKTFAGLVDTWDVVNEVVATPDNKTPGPLPAICRQLGRGGLLNKTFAAARTANRDGMLILNDYNTSPKYEQVIRGALAAGISIDAIGIQSHMHFGYWEPQKTWDICERFGAFDRPIHFTELTIISGPKHAPVPDPQRATDWLTTPDGEKRQAEQAEQFYTILFSHPAVAAITWWDFSDLRSWKGAPSGLIRKDMTPKPAFDALHRLIKKEWWIAEVRATTDAKGQITFRGYLGDYAIQAPAAAGAFTLKRAGAEQVTATLSAGK